MKLYKYEVLSPVYEYVEAVPGCYGEGPRYETSEYYEVEADTASQAKWIAYKISQKENPNKGWSQWNQDNELHPLHGARAKRI